jgi:UDP-glucose 4,6-dehydratase
VDTSFGNSILFTESNIFGTHCLLEASRIYNKLRKFVHISTDEVYGEWPAGAPNSSAQAQNNAKSLCLGSCHETAVLNPTNPYAATKAAAEFLVKSYGESFKLPYVITRGNNVYGPYQFPEKVIPRFITTILNDQKMTIHGDGKQVRNFIYVTDTVRAVDLVICKGKTKMIYNIGSKDEIRVMEIASILLKLMKPDSKLEDSIIHVKDRYFNDCRYSVMTDALESLGWKQQVKFDDGIRMTIQWYTENPEHWSHDAIHSIQ